MAKQSPNPLRVIKIMDPLLCVRCDNAYIADVLLSDGVRKKMFYCSRLDCDNWVSRQAESFNEEDLDLAA
ncbi:MAG: hypothetical protein N3B12_03850 [Armatimonadetes bacterium]|nr:hypothetical protein [Armatimonadota bacterium]